MHSRHAMYIATRSGCPLLDTITDNPYRTAARAIARTRSTSGSDLEAVLLGLQRAREIEALEIREAIVSRTPRGACIEIGASVDL